MLLQKRVIPLLALTLLLAGAAAAWLILPERVNIADDWTSSDPPVSNRDPCNGIHGGPYPSRAPRTVVLPPYDKRVRYGYDCYVDDYKVESRLEFRDGTREVIRYRPDRTVKERTRYLATIHGENGRVLSHATYAKDGVTFTRHDVYRRDGTLERSGKRERDGRYLTRYYYDDGVTVERFRVFSVLLEFVSERQYRRDGTELASVVVTTKGTELGVTLYSPDGKKTAVFYRTIIGEHGYVYHTDGDTILLEYASDPYFKASGHFDANKRLLQKRSSRFNRLTIAFLSKDERRTYNQIWSDGEKPKLRRVEESDFATGSALREIQMNKDGTKPAQVVYPQDNGGTMVRILDDNGNVVRIEWFDKEKVRRKWQDVTGVMPEVIPREALQEPEPAAPQPKFKIYGPPLVYDYE